MSGNTGQTTQDKRKQDLLDKIKRDAVRNSEFGPPWRQVALLPSHGLTIASIAFFVVCLLSVLIAPSIVLASAFTSSVGIVVPGVVTCCYLMTMRLEATHQDKLIRCGQLLGVFNDEDVASYVNHKCRSLFKRAMVFLGLAALGGIALAVVTVPGVLPHFPHLFSVSNITMTLVIALSIAMLAYTALVYVGVFFWHRYKHQTMFSNDEPVLDKDAQEKTFVFKLADGPEIRRDLPLGFDPKLSSGDSQVDVAVEFEDHELAELATIDLNVPLGEEIYVSPNPDENGAVFVYPGRQEIYVRDLNGNGCKFDVSIKQFQGKSAQKIHDILMKETIASYNTNYPDKEQLSDGNFNLLYGGIEFKDETTSPHIINCLFASKGVWFSWLGSPGDSYREGDVSLQQ